MEASKILLLLGFFILTPDFSAGGTLEILLEVAKLLRDVCQPKFKVPNDLADGLKLGNFPENKSVKCYVNCIMELQQVMKKGKFLYESALKQAEILLPEEMLADYRNGFTACKDSAIGIKNRCEASYTLLQCIQKNTKNFIFA